MLGMQLKFRMRLWESKELLSVAFLMNAVRARLVYMQPSLRLDACLLMSRFFLH